MTSATFVTVTPKPCSMPLWKALRAASRRITWRTLAGTLAIGVAFDMWSMVTITQSPHQGYLSATVANLLMAFSLMLATFVADEHVARGVRRLPAYACAVMVGSAVAALGLWPLLRWLPVAAANTSPWPPAVVASSVFFEYLIWGGIIVFIYVNHRTAVAAAARMNAAQLEQARARRAALESRLQAFQARVEPQFLFNTLAQVREAHMMDRTRGASMLDDLIVYLRASLPHLRDSTSTVAQELDLVGAYARIMRGGAGTAVVISADETALALPMPAMVLMPLIDLLWGKGRLSPAGAVEITASSAAGILRVEVLGCDSSNAAGDAVDGLRDICDRLQALYAERATVYIATANNQCSVSIQIPCEAADGSHR